MTEKEVEVQALLQPLMDTFQGADGGVKYMKLRAMLESDALISKLIRESVKLSIEHINYVMRKL